MKNLFPNFLIAVFLGTLLTFGITLGYSQSASSSKGGVDSISTSGPATTVSACGVSPSAVTGNNYAGRLTTGSGPNASCTITFVPAFTVAPACVVSGGFGQDMTAATTTTTLIITAPDLTSRVIAYICAKLP